MYGGIYRLGCADLDREAKAYSDKEEVVLWTPARWGHPIQSSTASEAAA